MLGRFRPHATVLFFICLPFVPVIAHRMLSARGAAETPRPSQGRVELLGSQSVGVAVPRRRRGDDPISISKRALKEACARWPRQLSGIPRWRRIETDHFNILTNAPADEIRWLCYTLEWSLDRVCDELRLNLPPLIYVMAFRHRSQFESFLSAGGPPDAESLYDPARRQIVLPMEPGERASRLAPIVHEVTHAAMHQGFGTVGPAWVAEGAAEFLTVRILNHLGAALQPDWERLSRERGRPPVRAFMNLSIRDFCSGDARIHYAHAVSWTQFLIEHKQFPIPSLLKWSPTPAELHRLEQQWRTPSELPGGTRSGAKDGRGGAPDHPPTQKPRRLID